MAEYILYTPGEYVILKNDDPYCNIEKFTGISESFKNKGVGTILKKEFRYSRDGSTFSEFVEVKQKELENAGSFDKVWLEFRYILLSGGPITIESITPVYTSSATDDYALYTAPNKASENAPLLPTVYRTNFLWNPYNMAKAIRLYKDLNLMVNTLFGHDVHYYRVLPKGRSRDVFLMEYSLYEHDDKQCMKVVVPGNEFPDNKFNMGPFGVDFEMPFEVQIDKDYFQNVFGDGTGPQKRDVIYFPLMNRIYEVSSSYLFRDFMYEPLYFKVTLIKWQPKTNVGNTTEVSSLLDFTNGVESLFGDEMKAEERKITNPQQFNVATTSVDEVRSYIIKDQNIEEERLINYSLVISEYIYPLSATMTTKYLNVGSITETLEKNKIYYARYSPSSIQDDQQKYYSMKRFKYLGLNDDGDAIFSCLGGNSQIESTYFSSEIFFGGSEFSLYENEYTGIEDESVISCNRNEGKRELFPVVSYSDSSDFPSDENRSFSCWFRLEENSDSVSSFSVESFDKYSRELTIVLQRNEKWFVGDDVKITKTLYPNFVLNGTVSSVVSKNRLKIRFEQYMLDFVSSVNSEWFKWSDMKISLTKKSVFVSSEKDDVGIELSLFGNRHFNVKMNGKDNRFSIPLEMDALNNDEWYGLFVNFGNSFEQLTLNVWKRQWNSSTNLPATTDLRLIYNKTMKVAAADRSSGNSFKLFPSYMDMTNIRLFKNVVETDKQPIILNQNIVQDSDLAIIIDNAVPQSHLPYIGYTR